MTRYRGWPSRPRRWTSSSTTTSSATRSVTRGRARRRSSRVRRLRTCFAHRAEPRLVAALRAELQALLARPVKATRVQKFSGRPLSLTDASAMEETLRSASIVDASTTRRTAIEHAHTKAKRGAPSTPHEAHSRRQHKKRRV
eukprot:Unigene12319_Nuclearia_a/m.37444 Unigene12319_Nuclearia_a/g.37444  ORF Unigene12319_Nuclearia_a/g.37444 Unigene12319_Nuclearia_a/m.37444 type:complete len:142 (+) Unigene12319_Nuclearia_a:255-680(+)